MNMYEINMWWKQWISNWRLIGVHVAHGDHGFIQVVDEEFDDYWNL